MFPDSKDIGLVQCHKVLLHKESSNDCNHFRLGQIRVAFPVAGFIATFLDAFECVNLNTYRFRFQQNQLTI